MRSNKARSRVSAKQQVPRIRPAEAAKILEKCGRVLENSRDLLGNLRCAGLGELLGRLDDKMLQLAIQPDSWGERTRAQLMSEIAPGLGGNSDRESGLSIEDIADVANVVMPCLLLEIGRRKQHIQIEFPPNPTDSGSCLKFRAAPTHPIHSISNEQLLRLVSVAGEALVGLCYFGDQEDRTTVEAELSLKGVPAATAPRPGRTAPSPETKH